jgi:hypothetical protein
MCNGWNHRSDCRCGFGPPYAVSGHIILGKREEWLDYSSSNEKAFLEGMKSTGFPEEVIKKGISSFEQAVGNTTKFISSMKKLIGHYKEVEIEHKIKHVRINLFKLHLPKKLDGTKVENSRVTFKESQIISKSNNWSVDVFGSGMGSKQTLSIECSTEVTAENGNCKIVFVTIPIRVSKIARYKGKKAISFFTRPEFDKSKSCIKFHNGAKTCDEKECKKDHKLIGHPTGVFELSEDTNGDISIYTERRSYGSGNKKKIGFNAFGMNSFIEVRIHRQKQIALIFGLPGGYDYILFTFKNEGGIIWKTFEAKSELTKYLIENP